MGEHAQGEAACFNLLDERWIPVLYADGRFERVGIRTALEEAGSIRQIAASHPLDQFAEHRFLLTLLYWKADGAGGVRQLRQMMLKGEMPSAITAALAGEASRFRLFDAKRPFLQDITAHDEEPKSAGSLFAEMACGTNIAHFNHGDDGAARLCLSCAAIGMLRLIPWSQSGGAGLTPAVHNAPPIMALACGRNLAETLGLNLVPLEAKPGTATWSGCFVPADSSAAIPILEALTWNPRRVHLGTPTPAGTCWRCGQSGVPVVGPVVYAKNPATKQNKKGGKTIPFQWQDPAAFYSPEAPYTTVKSYDERLAASGRDLAVLTKNEPPVSLVARANPDHHNWLLIVPCTNPANNKSYDQRCISTATLAPDALRALLPPNEVPARQTPRDGWTEPASSPNREGSRVFVRTAVRLLSHDDWAIVAAAAYREMHDAPAAFDLLTGLLWPLRRKVPGVPSRNAAWLVLKLMAAVPAAARMVPFRGGFCPLRHLPRRQIDEQRGGRPARSPYPVSLPRGHRLESALRQVLHEHQGRSPAPVDWAELCQRLDRLLD